MAGTNIGTAYVQILPSTQGIGSGIATALGGGSGGGAIGSAVSGAINAGVGASFLAKAGNLPVVGGLAKALLNPVTIAAAGVTTLGKESVKTGMEFDASMSQVYSLMSSVNDGVGLTADEMGRLRDRAREMGASTQFTAAQSAEAMGYMALAGWDVDQIYSGIPDVLDLAAASSMDLGRASDIVTDYMGAFANTAPTATHLVDMLSYAQSNSNATTEQFAHAWQYSAGMMNAAGQSADTATAILARLADQGHKASTGGTELNAVMTELFSNMDKNGNIRFAGQLIPLAEATENFNPAEFAAGVRQLNEELFDLDPSSEEYIKKINNFTKSLGSAYKAGNFRNVIDVFGDMQQILSDRGIETGSVAYMNTLRGVFQNVRSSRGIAAILNGDVEAMKNFEAALGESGGTAAEQAKIVNDNLAGDLKILKSATDEAGIAISDLLTPALRTGTQVATGFMQNLGLLLSGKGAEGAATKSISEIAEGFDKLSDVDYETTGRRIDGMIQKLSDANIPEEDRAALRTALQEILQSVENTDDTTEAGKNAMEGVAEGMLHYDFSESEGTIKENIVSAINDALQAHSPAQALVPSGENAAAGIMEGLTGYDYASGTAAATQAIVSAIVANFAAGGWDDAGAAVSHGVGAGISSRKSAVTSAVSSVISAAKSKAASEVGSGGANFKKYGSDISAGIAAGITGNKNKISDALVAAFSDAIQKLRADLGLHSPSRVFADVIGKNVSLGIAKGITDYAHSIDEALGAAMLPVGGDGLAYRPEFAGAESRGFTQNITVNSPKALTPAEIARQTRNATRQLVLAMER